MTRADVLHQFSGFYSTLTVSQKPATSLNSEAWNEQKFAEDQVCSLVRQLFSPGSGKASRQVLFAGVDHGTDTAAICRRVANALSAQVPGTICIVETATRWSKIYGISESDDRDSICSLGKSDWIKDSALQLTERVWHVPARTFLQNAKNLSMEWLRDRVDELRLSFDYTIFQSPCAADSNDAALLGRLCDGVVLVLKAGSTRRMAAKNVKDALSTANARVLGTVLTDRKFLIPPGIYRRL